MILRLGGLVFGSWGRYFLLTFACTNLKGLDYFYELV
jgi:hypothetical protein